jgi:nucleoside-diphosphate-sugar epimerase
MSITVFVAGASGAIGRRLTPLLLDAGYTVYGTTRSAAKAAELEANGVRPIVVDVYDARALSEGMARVMPEIVVHQLTDLPQDLGTGLTPEALAQNARVRVEGTENLVRAALACSARYIVAQSLITVYAAGPEPHVESDPLDASRDSVITLERLVTQSPPLIGAALRFGMLHGPGTWYREATGTSPVHVDAAAWATMLAIERSATGVFNITEERGFALSARAHDELGWSPDMRVHGGA